MLLESVLLGMADVEPNIPRNGMKRAKVGSVRHAEHFILKLFVGEFVVEVAELNIEV